MPSVKIPISFNESEQAQVKAIARYLGMDPSRNYGTYPMVVKLSISLCLRHLEEFENGIPDLSEKNLHILFQSIEQKSMQRKKVQKKEKASQDTHLGINEIPGEKEIS
jgi:hypothetical protein